MMTNSPQLLSGGNIDIDVDDLRKNTRYTGGYSDGSRTVKLFWEVFRIFGLFQFLLVQSIRLNL